MDSIYLEQLRLDRLTHLSRGGQLLCEITVGPSAQRTIGGPYCEDCVERAGQLEAREWVVVLEEPGPPPVPGPRQRASSLAESG